MAEGAALELSEYVKCLPSALVFEQMYLPFYCTLLGSAFKVLGIIYLKEEKDLPHCMKVSFILPH